MGAKSTEASAVGSDWIIKALHGVRVDLQWSLTPLKSFDNRL